MERSRHTGICSLFMPFSWVAPHGFVIPKYVVAVVYGKDLIVAIGSLILLSIAGKVTVTPRPLGKLSTFLQLSLLIATLISPDILRLSERLAWWLTRILWLAVVTITAASCIDYIVQGVAQLGESRKTPVT